MMEASTLPVPDPNANAAGSLDDKPARRLIDLLPIGRTRLVVGVLGVVSCMASFADFGASGRALVGAALCPVLVLLAAVDLEHRLLPNAIVFPSALLVGLIVAAADPAGFFEHLEAGLALGIFLFVFAALVPSALGMGDAKVGLLLGLALGSRTLSAMLIAFFGLFVAALWILSTKGLSARKQTIPFGPFLAAGGIAAFFLL